MTLAPAAVAVAAVSSVDPSSITKISSALSLARGKQQADFRRFVVGWSNHNDAMVFVHH